VRRGAARSRSVPSSGWTKPTLNARDTRGPRFADSVVRRSGAPRAPFVLLVLGLLVGGLLSLLALNTVAAAAELQRHQLAATNADLADNVTQLGNELAAKQAPAALAAAAAKLGMVPDQNPAFLQVRPDGSVVVLGSPAAATAAPKPKATTSKAPTKATPTVKSTKPAGTRTSATPTPSGTSVPVSPLPGGPR